MARDLTAFLLAAFLLLGGCSSRPVVERLKFGMTKDQVAKLLGPGMVPRGVTFNQFDQVVEVFEYPEYAPVAGKPKATSDTLPGQPSAFYLFFYQDQLVQWGEADDWREAAKLLYETKFW